MKSHKKCEPASYKNVEIHCCMVDAKWTSTMTGLPPELWPVNTFSQCLRITALEIFESVVRLQLEMSTGRHLSIMLISTMFRETWQTHRILPARCLVGSHRPCRDEVGTMCGRKYCQLQRWSAFWHALRLHILRFVLHRWRQTLGLIWTDFVVWITAWVLLICC